MVNYLLLLLLVPTELAQTLLAHLLRLALYVRGELLQFEKIAVEVEAGDLVSFLANEFLIPCSDASDIGQLVSEDVSMEVLNDIEDHVEILIHELLEIISGVLNVYDFVPFDNGIHFFANVKIEG